jgi:glycosyltransferase involved in cell wall biosynthesis
VARILLSAFACEPGKGSEPEVGFRCLLAAAERHDVWLLTSSSGVRALRRYLDGDARASRITIEALPSGFDEGTLNLPSFHWHYDRWQRQAGSRALELHRRIDFALVHHVTMSTLWTRVGVGVVPRPLIWGPVGGGVEPPLRLLPELGVRGLIGDTVRVTARRVLARLPPMRLAAENATVVFAQNHQAAVRVRSSATPVVLPNATLVHLNGVVPSAPRTDEVTMVGRLVAWKGGQLALRAFRHLRHPTATLHIYGSGADRRRLEAAARRWGLDERVRFEDWVPRNDLLARVARSAVLLHPSLHDDSPMSVAEALALGTPVVCLDHGGPAEVARRWSSTPSRLIAPGGPDTTASRMAQALDHFLEQPVPIAAVPRPPDSSFTSALASAYESAIAAQQRG